MMNQGGLSAMGMEAQEPRQAEMGETPMQEGQEQGGITIEDVIKALMQGISPEELVKAGVPPEMIQQAIQMMQSQMQGQQAPQQGGLSQAGMQ